MSRFQPINWYDYERLVQRLAIKILRDSSELDLIIGISRCGLTLGNLLSDLLQKEISVLSLGYFDEQKKGKVILKEELNISVKNRHILLVDGTADSGKTLLTALKYLNSFKPKDIKTATIFYKPYSRYKPDYYVLTTRKWVVLPHEFIEWGYSLYTKLRKENQSIKSIRSYLNKLSITSSQFYFIQKAYAAKSGLQGLSNQLGKPKSHLMRGSFLERIISKLKVKERLKNKFKIRVRI